MRSATTQELGTPAEVDACIRGIVSCSGLARRTERVPLARAHGRTLAESVVSDRDQPPFNRSAMDGIAAHGEALGSGAHSLRCMGTLTAGSDPKSVRRPEWAELDTCVEIMTGAPVPPEFDTVVRYEDLSWPHGRDAGSTQAGSPGDLMERCEVAAPGAKPGRNIHGRGSDYAAGECLAAAGTTIDVGLVATLATCGYDEVVVRSLPRIAVVSTGDELVPVSSAPLDHQIRASNPATLAAELGAWGLAPAVVRIVGDDESVIRETIAELAPAVDALVFSGAVSKGVTDHVPALLRELGTRVAIHGVRQRPGKPLLVGSRADCLVLGLPGNPVSALVCVRRYLVPALLGDERASGFPVRLGVPVEFPRRLTWYPVLRLARGEHGLVAVPTEGNGSGDFSQLVGSSGLGVVDESIDRLEEGQAIWFYPWG